jgi:hypothetical protein
MKRTIFWADENGRKSTVRCGNEELAVDCTPSEARAIAKKLNDTLHAAFGESRAADRLRDQIGKLSPLEKRTLDIVQYAVMVALDHES